MTHATIRLLGPVEVAIGGTIQGSLGLRRSALLSVLSLNAGSVVAVDSIIAAVWNTEPPISATNTVQSHASYLRKILQSRDAIVACGNGYRVNPLLVGTDLGLFENEVRTARVAIDTEQRAELLERALSRWRGEALLELASLPWFNAQARRLATLYLNVQNELTELWLESGQHLRVVETLQCRVDDHQYDEEMHRHLMLALYQGGRQAEALNVYHRLRVKLRDDLGLRPNGRLRDLHVAILRQDGRLSPATGPKRPATRHRATPSLLPPVAKHFVGRESEFSDLERLTQATEHRGPTFITVSGTRGVGKTALITHWGRRVMHRFPNGQLYASMTDPRMAADADNIATHFLSMLGVSVPGGSKAAGLPASLFRSVAAHQRLLVVLDDVADAGDIRPLLPGTGDSVVVAISRRPLTSFIAAEGAHSISLDALNLRDSLAMLGARLGEEALSQHRDSVRRLVEQCRGIPVELASLAARISLDHALIAGQASAR